MAKKGNSLGGLLILPFLLGAYLYFYYYYITIPITIILAIVIWKRKWIGKQLSGKPNYKDYRTKSNHSRKYEYGQQKNQYSISPYLLHSTNNDSITYLSEEFSNNISSNKNKISIPPIVITQKLNNPAVSKVPIIFNQNPTSKSPLFSISKIQSNTYSKTSSKNIAPQKKIIPSETSQKLKKYSLSENDAQILLGNDWKHQFSEPDSSFVWTLQSVVLKIQHDSKYRKSIGPFFENTLQLIEDTYQNVPSIVHSCGINFEDIFVWTGENDQKLTAEYKTFKQSSGKFSKYFEKVKRNSTISKSKSIPALKKELTLPIALAILGLNSKCDFKQIRSALISKTLQFHPDRNPSPDAPMKMAEINSAYDFLEKNFKGGKK